MAKNVPDLEAVNQDSKEPESISLDNFVLQTINFYLRYGGSLVTKEQYQERIGICKGCKFVGEVKIQVPGKTLVFDGCLKCGCPLATKPRAKKYFSLAKLRVIKAECPEGLWPDIL